MTKQNIWQNKTFDKTKHLIKKKFEKAYIRKQIITLILDVTGEQIGLALNHVESLLNSQSSVNPALNLIIYIPTVEQ